MESKLLVRVLWKFLLVVLEMDVVLFFNNYDFFYKLGLFKVSFSIGEILYNVDEKIDWFFFRGIVYVGRVGVIYKGKIFLLINFF